MAILEVAPWWRRHPVWAGAVALLTVAVLAAGVVITVTTLTAPAVDCGAGMVPDKAETACVGVDLEGAPIAPDQPERLGQLIQEVKAANETVRGDNYVSIVFLLNLSPVAGRDTVSFVDIFDNIEGAITAAWQANHTAVYDGTPQGGATPQAGIKLFLANMGSKNAEWDAAVTQIGTAAAANHITSVVGLGQSTTPTREAATKLTTVYRLPVIGNTVTGDSMNFDVHTSAPLDGFFRVAPTNTGMVVAAADYIAHGLGVTPDRVAVVEDHVGDDDYIKTLKDAAHANLGTAHLFPFTSPGLDIPTQDRDRDLKGQFGYLNINLCSARPEVVYFAGRGVDLGAFVTSWTEGGTDCSLQPLTVLTGDDGVEAIASDAVANAVGTGRINVRYTAIASSDKWGECPGGSPSGHADVAARRAAFDQFRAAFTNQPSCYVPAPAPTDGARPPGFDEKGLQNGQAMVSHDAVGLAVTVARRAGASAVTNPWSQIGVLQEVRCKGVFHGAGGEIAFSPDPAHHGNPIGMMLPIIGVQPGKKATTVSTGWSTGGPPADTGC